ncbi:MAG TPA: hypothetical protein VGE74_08010 [Gemmata sp.]
MKNMNPPAAPAPGNTVTTPGPGSAGVGGNAGNVTVNNIHNSFTVDGNTLRAMLLALQERPTPNEGPREPLRARADGAPCIMVLVQKSARIKCHLQAWIFPPAPENGTRQGEWLVGPEELSQRQIPEYLARVRDRAGDWITQRYAPGEGPLTQAVRVEFMLPSRLMALAVDRWQIAGEPLTIGKLHPVTVRRVEWEYSGSQQADGSHRWGRLKETAEYITDLVPRDAPSIYRLSTSTWKDGMLAHLSRACVTCVVFDSCPHPNGKPQPPLQAILKRGIPLVIWLRIEPTACTPGCASLHQLLSPRPANDIPARVWELRGAAGDGDENHPGHHLTLLYEDPRRRCPALAPYTPPREEQA